MSASLGTGGSVSRFIAPAAQDFVDTLLRDRNLPTVRKVTTSLKMMLSTSVRRGKAAFNAATEVEIPTSERHERRVECPEQHEIKTLLAADGDLRPYVHTGILTGLRSSEMRGLKWRNIDLKAGEIRVRERADRWDKLGKLKSKAGLRDVPIGPNLMAMLREWKVRQAVEQRKLDLVFPDAGGNVQDHTAWYRAFCALQVSCGITKPQIDDNGQPMRDEEGKPLVQAKYGLHAMRHACASLLIAKGWQAKRVQVFLGHASIKITLDTYAHLLKDTESDQQAVAALESALLG